MKATLEGRNVEAHRNAVKAFGRQFLFPRDERHCCLEPCGLDLFAHTAREQEDRAMPYMSAGVVDGAIDSVYSSFPTITNAIALPERSSERRLVGAIKLAGGTTRARAPACC